MRRELAISIALGLAVAAVYGQTLGFGFVNFDDVAHISQNPMLRDGLTREAVVWAFSNGETGSWHPLTWLSHMLDMQLYGANAGGHHATNVLLHLANSLLLFALLRSATGALWRAALVAALFALHPLHVESVAWITERRDLLSTSFGLLGIAAHVGYARRGGARRYLAVALFFALSLLAKPMLVTLPCVLLLFDYWPLRRSHPLRLLLEKLPLFAMALACSLVTVFFQQRAAAVATTQALALGPRAANAVFAYAWYLLKLVWPTRLALYYPHPYIAGSGGEPPPAWQLAGAAALLLAVSLLALRARERRYLTVGWLWYLGTLVPVIGFVQVGMQAYADRYSYVPSIGIFVAVAWGAGDLVSALRPRLASVGALAASAAGAVLLTLAVGAWLQTRHWRDSLSLFEHTLASVPRNPVIRYNFANQLRDLGRLDDAIRAYERVLEEAPADAKARVNLANVLRSQGRLDEAALQYRTLLEHDPGDAMANNGLATLLRAREQPAAAEVYYRRALAREAGNVAGYNLGNLLRSEGRLGEALAVYREALRHRPRDPKLHNNLAAALEAAGDPEAALEHYQSALQLDPGYRMAHTNLAALLQRRGELTAAIAHYRRALALAPDDPAAREALAQALAQQRAQQP